MTSTIPDSTSPSDELRSAANRIEATAAAASKNVCPSWTYSAVRHIARNCEIGCDHHDPYSSSPPPDDGLDHDGWSRYEDAPWISLMDARTAPTLIGWLRVAAEFADEHPEFADPATVVHDVDFGSAQLIRTAIDYARLVNGTSS